MPKSAVNLRLYGDTGKPGFRPLLWRLVSDAGFSGWLAEENGYDVLYLEGNTEELDAFLTALPILTAPQFKLEKITEESRKELEENRSPKKQFQLMTFPSELTDIQPDYAPCQACLNEVMNPSSRRFRYPFFSCAQCGPSYSMMKSAPMQRQDTFFAPFPSCSKCRHEAEDPQDQLHFGSELSVCPECGPRLILIDSDGETVSEEKCLEEAARTLKQGRILAVQFLYGGFQLFVNASDADAVAGLRKCAKIPELPIPVIARNIESVRHICECGAEEEALLKSQAAPGVILSLRQTGGFPDSFHPEVIVPGSPAIAVSLPQTLLQHLLFACPELDGIDVLATFPMTRMRLNEATGLEEIYESLRGSADCFLLNDLPVGMDCPASLAVIREGRPQLIRRSRGYVPSPVSLNVPLRRSVLAFGSDQISTICLGAGKKIILSQPLGEIDAPDKAGHLDYMAELFTNLFDTVPDVIACDRNTELHSSVEAARFAGHFNLPLVMVETHHAHALSCMAENGLEHALALVFDSGAPGPDGSFRGAELLDAEIASFRRLASFEAVSLPGGGNALKRPARQFAGRVISAGGTISPEWCKKLDISQEEINLWTRNCTGQGIFSLSHAAGCLFDAFSAGLGLSPAFITYRRQAEKYLNYAALRGARTPLPDSLAQMLQYHSKEQDGVLLIDWAPLFRRFSETGPVPEENIPSLAFAFHSLVADACRDMVEYAAAKTPVRDIVLSGNLFQNGLLSDLTAEKLRQCGFRVFLHHEIPSDEAGLSAGQVYHAGFSD